jgi:PPM family protein phosphatase
MSWPVPRFDYLVNFGGASHVGNVRPNNEDVWFADPELGVFLIADGMGGHAAGQVAAQMAVDEAVTCLRSASVVPALKAHLEGPSLATRAAVFRVLEHSVRAAQDLVLARAKGDPQLRGMGTTLDVLLLLGSQGFLVHVGDNRAYLSRPATTIQLTTDHTLRGSLMAQGLGSPSQPPETAERLTNAIGREGTLQVDELFVELAPGDRIVLCSDGIYDELGSEAMLQELAVKGRPDECVILLINAALSRKGKDNATAIVIDIGQQRVQRSAYDGGLAARDHTYACHSPLFHGLKNQLISLALQSAIEVSFDAGEVLPRFDAADRVGYIVLEGSVATPQGWTLGPPSLLYPEGLAGGGRGRELCQALQETRTYRIRADDLREVCSSNHELAAKLYERLARNLARMFG